MMDAMTGRLSLSWRRTRDGPVPVTDEPSAADVVLLSAVAGGDSAALTELSARHGRALFGYLLRLAARSRHGASPQRCSTRLIWFPLSLVAE
jgi:hypothetical protein